MLLLAILLGKGRIALADRTSTRLRRWMITRYHAKRWILAIGKVLPLGLGAAIGAAGNRAYGRTVVATSRQVFSPTVTPEPTVVPEISTVHDQPATQVVDDRLVTSAVDDPPAIEPPAAVPDNGPQAAAVVLVTGKYRPLFDYLAANATDHVEISFFEIDQLVTGGLPKSASAQRGWWGNSPGRVQAKAWLAAGFQVADVDLAATTVRFERRS